MKKAIDFYIFLLLLGIGACIPIEDRLAPQVTQIQFDGQLANINIDAKGDRVITDTVTYHVLDTISLFVGYSDNEHIDSIALIVSQGTGSIQNLEALTNRNISIPGGRLYQDTIKIPIPANIPEGLYYINIECYDLSKNMTRTYGVFRIESDIRGPIIQNFKVAKLAQDAQGNYITCRLETIDLEGVITDNIGISEVIVELSNGIQNRRDVLGDSLVSLQNLFGQDIRIPSSLGDNELFTLRLIVIDGNGNQSTAQARFVVGCDDQIPTLKIDSLRPTLNAEGEIDVIQGVPISVINGYLTDNFQMQYFAVTFNLKDAVRDTVFSINLADNQADTIFIQQLPKEAHTFNLPSEVTLSSTYELTFFLSDTAQNTATPISYLVNVIRDNIPEFSIVESFIINSTRTLDANDLNTENATLAPGDVIKVPAEITDNNFKYIRIYWGLEGSAILQHEILGEDLPQPYESYRFADPINNFRVPTTALSGNRYELRIEAKDQTNPAVSVRYFFRIR